MATIREIKEDFFYLYVVEIAFMIALIFNNVFVNAYLNAFEYFLIFLGIFIGEDKIYKAFLLRKSTNWKEKFLLLEKLKSGAKASLSFFLVLLIFSSSWGIISFLSGFWEYTIQFSALLTYIIPWYIGIYVGWLVYLSYLKGRYKKLIISLLKGREEKLRIYHLLLLHKEGKLLAVISLHPLGEKEREKLKKEIILRKQDFHWNGLKVAIEEEQNLKLALIYKGKITQKLRLKMKDSLRKILLAHPGIREGSLTPEEVYDVESLLKRDILNK